MHKIVKYGSLKLSSISLPAPIFAPICKSDTHVRNYNRFINFALCSTFNSCGLMDLTHFRSGPGAHLSGLSFEGQ
jgi:hypothetical protein